MNIPLQVPAVRTTAIIVRGELGEVRIPSWVNDLESFRTWIDADDWEDEKTRVCFLDGDIWVDMMTEQIFTHNRVKLRYTVVLDRLVEDDQLGYIFSDGLRLTHPGVNFSVRPDAMFVSWEALKQGRVRLVEGAKTGFVELEGAPDMVLEILSDSSEGKDEIRLRDLYARAGIPEYWLVDVRGGLLRFEILRWTSKGYRSTRPQAGWLKSKVLGRSFQLTAQPDPLGHPQYQLAVRK